MPTSKTTVPTMLTVREVAEIVGITPRSVWRLVDRREFPAPRRIGRRILRWHADELEQWINAGCPKVNP